VSHTKTLMERASSRNQLSPLPKIGEGFGEWSEAPSYEEGVGVDGMTESLLSEKGVWGTPQQGIALQEKTFLTFFLYSKEKSKIDYILHKFQIYVTFYLVLSKFSCTFAHGKREIDFKFHPFLLNKRHKTLTNVLVHNTLCPCVRKEDYILF